MRSGNLLPRYIPELDGLRALAVLAVMLYHLSIQGTSLGWTGVMLFFVLSGFLITGILLDAKGSRHYFRNFYLRRAVRIFPIYYITLVAVIVVASYMGQDMADLGYYLTYTQNYAMGLTNYTARFPLVFNHTWSLAVEEQFYLLWPLAVLLLDRRWLLRLSVGLVVAAFLFRAFALFVIGNPALMYSSLPTEVDSLAAGAALAVLVRSGMDRSTMVRGSALVAAISAAALAMLVRQNGLDAYWHLDDWTKHAVNLPTITLIVLFWGGLLTSVVLTDNLVARLLRAGWLRQIGKISYGLYLYHFPIYFVSDKLSPNIPFQNDPLWGAVGFPAMKMLLTYLVALLSWKLIEERFLMMKDRLTVADTEEEGQPSGGGRGQRGRSAGTPSSRGVVVPVPVSVPYSISRISGRIQRHQRS